MRRAGGRSPRSETGHEAATEEVKSAERVVVRKDMVVSSSSSPSSLSRSGEGPGASRCRSRDCSQKRVQASSSSSSSSPAVAGEGSSAKRGRRARKGSSKAGDGARGGVGGRGGADEEQDPGRRHRGGPGRGGSRRRRLRGRKALRCPRRGGQGCVWRLADVRSRGKHKVFSGHLSLGLLLRSIRVTVIWSGRELLSQPPGGAAGGAARAPGAEAPGPALTHPRPPQITAADRLVARRALDDAPPPHPFPLPERQASRGAAEASRNHVVGRLRRRRARRGRVAHPRVPPRHGHVAGPGAAPARQAVHAARQPPASPRRPDRRRGPRQRLPQGEAPRPRPAPFRADAGLGPQELFEPL